MNREGHSNTKFFTGTEVEHTPAFGKQTLFVVGLQPVNEIAYHFDRNPSGVEHIYFGANMSFPSSIRTNDAVFWTPWEKMIEYFLHKGYMCTLDIDVSQVEGLLESGLCEHNNFIPMISVKLPYARQLGYNATIKIDDKDFDATNPGVWCHNLHDLMSRDKFTDWSKYTKDNTL
jgi:hypothetical protein